MLALMSGSLVGEEEPPDGSTVTATASAPSMEPSMGAAATPVCRLAQKARQVPARPRARSRFRRFRPPAGTGGLLPPARPVRLLDERPLPAPPGLRPYPLAHTSAAPEARFGDAG